MVKPRITMGLCFHPRTRALIEGEIGIDGYELDIAHQASAGEHHDRFAQGEWDNGECPPLESLFVAEAFE